MMFRKRTRWSVRLVSACVAAIFLASGVGQAAKKQKSEEYLLTEPELQLELMSYADRYAAVVVQALEDAERMDPPPETRQVLLGDAVFSTAAAFTTAADPEPQLALLDLVVMTTLGRMVYEDYWRPRLGAYAEPGVAAFTKLERDIWNVAAPILDADQQRELRERIDAFRENNPELSTFSHLRFADFPSKRADSTLKKNKSGGIFGSVRHISDQVEQTRILAERALYLSTRLPLLTGGFADAWTTRLSSNPAIEELRADLRTFAVVSDRLATVAEQLPEQITSERAEAIEQMAQEADTLRYEAIEQVFDGVAEERREILRQLIEEEQRLGGLITELRQTLEEANTLTLSADALAQRFDIGEPLPPGVVEEPFDIEEYRATLIDARAMITEANGLVQTTNELLNSPGADRLVPSLVEAINEAGDTSEGLVNHAVMLEIRIFGGASAG
jgi:Mg2+ and Co2+ transporter CorA